LAFHEFYITVTVSCSRITNSNSNTHLFNSHFTIYMTYLVSCLTCLLHLFQTCILCDSFTGFTLMVGWQEGHPARMKTHSVDLRGSLQEPLEETQVHLKKWLLNGSCSSSMCSCAFFRMNVELHVLFSTSSRYFVSVCCLCCSI